MALTIRLKESVLGLSHVFPNLPSGDANANAKKAVAA